MKTVNVVSSRGCLQDCEVCSSFEIGGCLVSVISKGPVIVLCVHEQICIFFFPLPILNYLVFNLACHCM